MFQELSSPLNEEDLIETLRLAEKALRLEDSKTKASKTDDQNYKNYQEVEDSDQKRVTAKWQDQFQSF